MYGIVTFLSTIRRANLISGTTFQALLMRRGVSTTKFRIQRPLIVQNSLGTCFHRFNAENHVVGASSAISRLLCSFKFETLQAMCDYRRYLCTNTVTLRQSWAMDSMRQWMCSNETCRKVNSGLKHSCEGCGAEKPNLGWKCVKCETKNHRGVKKCKYCGVSFELSKEFWMCAACNANNRIDDVDDNSRCGYCSYDMAPLSLTEEKAAEILHMRAHEDRRRQETFDSITDQDAKQQFGDVHTGHEILPTELKSSPYTAIFSNVKKLPIDEVQPFTPKPQMTAHSRLFRKMNSSAVVLGNARPLGPPGFDWMCRVRSCGHTNPGDEENCMKCGQPIKPSDWECMECAAVNHFTRSRCFNCFKTIPMYWSCAQCTALTSVYDKVCRKCGVERPPLQPREPSSVARDVANRQLNKRSLNSGKRSDWHCDRCSCMNFARRDECFHCGTPRPAFDENVLQTATDVPVNAKSGVSPSHQNWSCPGCQAANFRTRRECWKCGCKAPSMLSWAAESQAPHFQQEGFLKDSSNSRPAEGDMNTWKKSDDWICAKCFSKNFRSKTECFKCGSPKAVVAAPRRVSVRKPVKL